MVRAIARIVRAAQGRDTRLADMALVAKAVAVAASAVMSLVVGCAGFIVGAQVAGIIREFGRVADTDKPVDYGSAVEPGTVWTWNAIGKRSGAPGQGSGRKPAFGQLYTDAQIREIVNYVRSL